MIGKTCDGFLPIGPWLMGADLVGDPQKLKVETRVNGQTRQSSNTDDMIFTCAQIIAYASSLFTLYPGDVISTGTPEGVILGKPEGQQVGSRLATGSSAASRSAASCASPWRDARARSTMTAARDGGAGLPGKGRTVMEERIVELELKFTEQQRLLQELSEVIWAQGRSIERLEHELAAMGQKLVAMEPGLVDAAVVERPPHF